MLPKLPANILLEHHTQVRCEFVFLPCQLVVIEEVVEDAIGMVDPFVKTV